MHSRTASRWTTAPGPRGATRAARSRRSCRPPRASEAASHLAGPTPLSLPLEALLTLRFEAGSPSDTPLGRGPWAGAFRAATRGQGTEVDDLRPYLPGDDPRHIDWKTSARLGEPHTRLYREERDHALSVVLDLRDTLFTGSTNLRAGQAARLALRHVWRSALSGGRARLVVFDAQGVHLSSAARGERGALDACVLAHDRHARRLASVEERWRTATDAAIGQSVPDLSVLVDRLLIQARSLGSVQLISPLDDASLDTATHPGCARELRRLALAAPLCVTLIEDALEHTALPTGTYRYRGGQGDVRVHLTRRQRPALADAMHARRRAIAALCQRCGAGFELATPGIEPVAPAAADR